MRMNGIERRDASSEEEDCEAATQQFLDDTQLGHPTGEQRYVSAVDRIWKMDAFFPALRRPVSDERLVDAMFSYLLSAAVDSLRSLYGVCDPMIFWSTIAYSEPCRMTIATALEVMPTDLTVESMARSLVGVHVRQLGDESQRRRCDSFEIDDVLKIAKTHSARPLHDLRRILLCVLHRASGADSEWNKNDVPLSRRCHEEIVAGIFDVHAVVALVNSYWRTDAEIVLEILKQLPTRIVEDTVQAFVTVTPKMCAASRSMLCMNRKLQNLSVGILPDQAQRIVSDIRIDVVRLNEWFVSIEMCCRAMPVLAFRLKQNSEVLCELARWQYELSEFALPHLKREHDEGLFRPQRFTLGRLLYTERQLTRVLHLIVERALLPVAPGFNEPICAPKGRSWAITRKRMAECESEAYEAYLRDDALHAEELRDASQYEEFMLTLMDNCPYCVLVYDHVYGIASDVEKFQCGPFGVVCMQLCKRLKEEHDRVASSVLRRLHDMCKLDAYIDGSWRHKYGAVANELYEQMESSTFGRNFIEFFVFYCAGAAEEQYREQNIQRSLKDSWPTNEKYQTKEEALLNTLREWLCNINSESLLWCVPKAVRMCQGGSDHLFAPSTPNAANSEMPYVDVSVEQIGSFKCSFAWKVARLIGDLKVDDVKMLTADAERSSYAVNVQCSTLSPLS